MNRIGQDAAYDHWKTTDPTQEVDDDRWDEAIEIAIGQLYEVISEQPNVIALAEQIIADWRAIADHDQDVLP